MAVIRVNKNKDFTVISNYHFRDKNLSLKAKGLLSQMLSLPEDWDYTIAGLVSINKENESAINSALAELKEHGYLIVTKKMPNETKSGRIEYEYDIYEKPRRRKLTEEKQGVENQGVVFQGVENQGQYNTDNQADNQDTNNQDTKNKNTDNKKYIAAIVEYLNEKADKHYRPNTESTIRHIKARLNEGFSVDDFYTVIDKKVAEWKNTEMDQYLRPGTLFGTKFESYLNARTIRQSRPLEIRGANGILLDGENTSILDDVF